MIEKPKNNEPSGTGVYELAGLVERAAASLIDCFLLLALVIIILLAFTQLAGGMPTHLHQFVGLAAPVAYHWYFWTRRSGQTPGKFALGIRVIKADGTALGDTDAVIRAIGYHVSAMLFGLGFVWALLDKNNQTWHDKLARSYVVRSDSQRKTIDVSR